jgi:hypothetical protein
MLIDVNALVHELQNGVVEIRFTKLNGEKRVMRSTLDKKIVPPATDTVTEGGVNSKQLLQEQSDPLLAVWDIDAKGWRSFHQSQIDSIQHLDVV